MTYGKFNVEYEQRIYNPERMRKYRLDRAHAMLKKHGLGSMVIMEFDNQQYFGFHSRRGWMRHRMVTASVSSSSGTSAVRKAAAPRI